MISEEKREELRIQECKEEAKVAGRASEAEGLRWGAGCAVCLRVAPKRTGDMPMHCICSVPGRNGSCSGSRSMGSMALDRFRDHPATHTGQKRHHFSLLVPCDADNSKHVG